MKKNYRVKMLIFLVMVFLASASFGQLTIGPAGPDATITCSATPAFTAPTASSGCSGVIVHVVSDITGGNSCSKIFIRVWNAVDDCGNTSQTVAQKITQVDNAPTISAATDATITCSSSPAFNAPTATDDCGAPTVFVLSTTSAGNACSTTFTRTWYAVDDCGNTSQTVAQKITQVDNAPTISAGVDATITCSSSPAFTAPTAMDDCSAPTVFVLSTTSAGNACSRTFTRTWYAVDACGNTSATAAQKITQMDLSAPTITAGANATIACSATPVFNAPTATDDCSPPTVVVLSTTTLASACSKSITRTWSAVDACGNSSTASQTIVISCGDNKILICHRGSTICIKMADVQSHLGHGDYLGNCVNPFTNASAGRKDLYDIAEERQQGLNATIYPNPSNRNFVIKVRTNDLKTPIELRVVDVYGRLLDCRNVNANSTIIVGDKYNPGVYIVTIMQNKIQKQIKLVKTAGMLY